MVPARDRQICERPRPRPCRFHSPAAGIHTKKNFHIVSLLWVIYVFYLLGKSQRGQIEEELVSFKAHSLGNSSF